MSLLEDLKYKYGELNVLEKIIAINIIIFIASFFLKPFMPLFFEWLELPSDFYAFLVKPWTIITYAFLHYKPLHILFNMIWLYFLGRFFINVFNSKTALNIYFLGAIFGGLFYLLGSNIFPEYFKSTSVVGASGAVRALLIFLCAYMPDKDIQIINFNLKLWWIGAVLVLFDVIGLNGLNAGGSLAHLGGAFLGYLYAKQLSKGKDIGKGFEGVMNTLSSWFSSSKKANLKTVHKNKTKVAGYKKEEFKELNKQKRIDVILDKISKSGYESLTAEEKDFLFRAGK